MDLGRFTLFSFAWIVTTGALLIVASVCLRVRSLVRNVVVRGLIDVLILAAFGLSPGFVDTLTRWHSRAAVGRGTYIDFSMIGFLLPASFAASVLLLAHLLFPAKIDRRCGRWRTAFGVGSVAFIALNTINLCNPGWCGRFGFPLPYSWWSDAMLIMDGQNLSAGYSRIALGIDVASFFALATAASVVYRRPRAKTSGA